MKDIMLFNEENRKNFKLRPVSQRLKDNRSVYKPLDEAIMAVQAGRCMTCGTTFCSFGCPLGNLISYWNEMTEDLDWKHAYNMLSRTSNFPEFTSRVCPALCEASCNLGVNHEPVSIREVEYTIIEHAFKAGWVVPRIPKMKTGKKIAIIGSGPAGLAAADELTAVGHDCVVFERNAEPGGLMRYGIPNFKLEKEVIDRRIDVMKAAGVSFQMNTCVGEDVLPEALLKDFDVLVLTGGSTIPRDLRVEGRDLEGIYYAVDYLENHTKRLNNVDTNGVVIDAKDKNVLVIGGGDTGSDCIGTANRQGAKTVYQIEIMPKPPKERDASTPWPLYPRLYKETSSHKEGCIQNWEINTKRILGDTCVEKVVLERIQWINENGRMVMKPIEDSEFTLEVDIILLAMGFVSPQYEGMVESLGLKLDPRGNLLTDEKYQTSVAGVFTAGDMRSGQSLVVRAIKEGREVAKHVDEYLMGETFIK
ncbi:glutamate synthase subunit beta [Fusibacter ferrireducens]|uniref:Glutamate synthase subunit beta n=1 Tax=Fusibacter ferrireducens TaxID=2785058 RepID=A0ABR9ZSS0_9FIRM|nr:glutamate synthase subunit beta [Fusibacter ferrireducens]MBF4693520.1 glutamate synthase subunit beta [Fusibacter ferrireducens]